MTVNIPTQCHLWHKNDLSSNDVSLPEVFDLVRRFETDDPHTLHSLLRCRDCGQLYFFEFTEWIDWEGGNDPQYCTWVPITEESDAEDLNTHSSFGLLSYIPRLQKDWPADASSPKIWWNR